MLKRFLLSAIVFIATAIVVAIYVCTGNKASSGSSSVVSAPASAVPITPAPVTPEPTLFIIPEPTVAVTVTPSPTPSPSPIPFSYYAPTVNMAFEELVGDNGNYDLPAGYPSADTYRIVVDKTFQVVIIYTKDNTGAYTVPVRYMLCSTGTKTPTGEFQMKRYRVRFGYFQNDKTFGQYWSLINGRIYFHSILYTERNNASSYIEEPYRLLGTPASHGCIRLTVPDARFIFYNIAYGTYVEIREGDPSDEETRTIREKLVLAPLPEERVTIPPETLPDTDNWHINAVKIDIPYEEGSQKGQE